MARTSRAITQIEMSEFSEGDIFYTFYDNQYHFCKLLRADYGTKTYHVLRYKPVDSIPDLIDELEVYYYHAPIAIRGFDEPVFFAKSPLTDEDLIGYHEFLRQTNDIEELTRIANNYTERASHQEGLQRYEEAIYCYSKAIELIPDFHEAIDNRAFCKMDLGLWKEAIADFQLSLAVHPHSLPAEFSIGECLIHLGDYKGAIAHFKKAMEIDPDHQASKDYLAKAIALDTNK